jgi:septal ring factor EnvC (AmiA/AmiB activator)
VLVSAVLVVAAAGVVAAIAFGDATILRVALAAVMAVTLVLALHGSRRTTQLRAALAGEAAARRAEVSALQRQAATLSGMVAGVEAGRLTLAAEVAGLRALVTRLETSLADAQESAEAARAEAADAAARAAAAEGALEVVEPSTTTRSRSGRTSPRRPRWSISWPGRSRRLCVASR